MEKTENKKLFNIFFAVAAGICIGFILIRECFANMSPWFSLVGGIIGAFSAYILNDSRAALRGIADAWSLTKHQAPKILLVALNAIWKAIKYPFTEDRGSRKEVFSFVLCFASIAFTTATYSVLTNFIFHISTTPVPPVNIFITASIIFLCLAPILVLLFGLASFKRDNSDSMEVTLQIAIWLHPVIHLSYLLYLFLITLPSVVKYTTLFGLKFLLLIHTTDRLISAVDAFLFTMLAYGVGVLSNSWVAGSVGAHLVVFAVAGGVFGVFNKLYIKSLLKMWVVKLTPATEEQT